MSTTDARSLQETYGPKGRCFGCGPANEKGLRIRSFQEGDTYVCHWQARPEHEAWEGTINGGIIGALFDCHCNWAAAHHLFLATGADELPSTVTAEFHVKLVKPTPSGTPVEIRARVVDASSRRATVEAEMLSGGEVTATCRGTFVSVPPAIPATTAGERDAPTRIESRAFGVRPAGRAETSAVDDMQGDEVLTARERPPGPPPDLYDFPEVYAALRAPADDLLLGVRRIIATYAHPPGVSPDRTLRLLDPACGPANWLVPFARDGHHVAGNDLSREMVRGARDTLSRMGASHEIVRGDMRHLALASGPFDVALEIAGSTGLLEQREDLLGLLVGVADHLVLGGIFAVTVFLDRRPEALDAAYPRLVHESPAIEVELADGHVGAATARYEHLGWTDDPTSARMRRTVVVHDLPGHPPEIVEDYTLRAWRLAEVLSLISSTARYDVLEIDALGPDAPDDPLGESTLVLRRSG